MPKGYQVSWNRYKLHLDTADCSVPVASPLFVRIDAQQPCLHSPVPEPRSADRPQPAPWPENRIRSG
jgi:hypothetical protein